MPSDSVGIATRPGWGPIAKVEATHGPLPSQWFQLQRSYIAVGYATVDDEMEAAVWTSPDGESWTRREDSDLGGGHSQAMTDVTEHAQEVVAVGYENEGSNFDAAVWRSCGECSEWCRVRSPPFDSANQLFGGAHFQKITSIAVQAGRLWLVGEDRKNAHAWMHPWDNELGWSRTWDDELGGDKSHESMNAVVDHNGTLLAVGFDMPDSDQAAERRAAVWRRGSSMSPSFAGLGPQRPGHPAVAFDGARPVLCFTIHSRRHRPECASAPR